VDSVERAGPSLGWPPEHRRTKEHRSSWGAAMVGAFGRRRRPPHGRSASSFSTTAAAWQAMVRSPESLSNPNLINSPTAGAPVTTGSLVGLPWTPPCSFRSQAGRRSAPSAQVPAQPLIALAAGRPGAAPRSPSFCGARARDGTDPRGPRPRLGLGGAAADALLLSSGCFPAGRFPIRRNLAAPAGGGRAALGCRLLGVPWSGAFCALMGPLGRRWWCSVALGSPCLRVAAKLECEQPHKDQPLTSGLAACCTRLGPSRWCSSPGLSCSIIPGLETRRLVPVCYIADRILGRGAQRRQMDWPPTQSFILLHSANASLPCDSVRRPGPAALGPGVEQLQPESSRELRARSYGGSFGFCVPVTSVFS